MARNKQVGPKQPKQTVSSRTAKKPRKQEKPESFNQMKPVWRIGQFDLNGPWGQSIIDIETLWDKVFPKLRDYESMTWGEIERDKKRDHLVPVDKLIVKAQKRLEQLRIEQEELFRFRFSGKQWLWGIRSLNEFTILWWDPNHEICPSAKKNT